MIRLFLYDKFEDATKEYEVELKEDIQISITKQFTDLSNPAAIKNDWSKTVAIPFTQKNNEIFGCLFRADRTVTDNAPVGQFDFDASKKVQFRLFNDSNLIMAGYMKVLNVEQKSSVVGSYNVTLNGELGRVFQELSNITFDRSSPSGSSYIINGGLYVSEEMNKALIKTCWTTDGQSTAELKKITDPDYKVTDIIGFAPNNAFSENFDYKSFESVNNEFQQFAKHLQEDWDRIAPNIGIEAETVIPDGLTPRGIGEYRSYLQIPYIYWNKLFNIFREKAEELTGYEFDLDEDWFNNNNPYWYDLVYCLDKPMHNQLSNFRNNYVSILSPNSEIEYPGYNRNINSTEEYFNVVIADEEKTLWNNTTNCFDFDDETIYVDNNSYDVWTIKGLKDESASSGNGGNALLIDYQFIDNSNDAIIKELHYALNINVSGSDRLSTYEYITPTEKDSEIEPGVYEVLFTYKVNLTTQLTQFDSNFFEKNVKLKLILHWQNTNTIQRRNIQYGGTGGGPSVHPPQGGINLPGGTGGRAYYFNCRDLSVSYRGNLNLFINYENDLAVRSFDNFILNDMWNNDFNIFKQILNYCKMFRIFIYVDDVNKKIQFVPFNKFFNKYIIDDWTDKIDYSKNWKVEPNIVESKYLLFNYDKSSNTELLNKYLNSFGVNYGEIKVNTNYAFDTNTKNMFESIKTSNASQQTVMSWHNLYDLALVEYVYDNEIFIDNIGEDNKEVNSFGKFYFYNGLFAFNNNEEASHLRAVELTDDTEKQIQTKTYMYNQTKAPYEIIPSYPYLSIFKTRFNKDYYVSLYETPKLIYSNLEVENCIGIYNAFWNDYLNDLYNVNTKKITCYVKLNEDEFYNFKFNHFVIVNNQLYIVNKIYDFNVNKNDSTKVELISINNIKNYTNSNFNLWYVTPKALYYTTSEFIGITFTYTLVDYDNLDLNDFTISLDTGQSGMPLSWAVNITTERIDDFKAYIKVKVDPPYVFQREGEYTISILVRKGNEQTSINANIYIYHPEIEEGELANESITQ